MEPIIRDSNSDERMTSLELFLERYLGPRQPEFGASDEDLKSIAMPVPLERLFRFAGQWPGCHPHSPYANCLSAQDALCAINRNGYAPILQVIDNRLVFVWECQGVWVAATQQAGADPPVWISQNWNGREPSWRQLERPLSHFLVSYVLQELMFGSKTGGVAAGVLSLFRQNGVKVEPVWMNGEYAREIDRPSYYLAGEHVLLRHAPREADGDDWYGCNNPSGAELLSSLDLPME